MGFERKQSILRQTCTTQGTVKGNEIIFDVVDSGSASAVTRGVNGLIPSRADDNTQNTCTLTEWHDKPVKTRFNIFASQGDQRAVMQETSMAVINRKIDDQIVAALGDATQFAGLAASTLTLDKAMHAVSIILGNNVPLDGQLSGLLTPAAWAYLMQVKEVTSKDYINDPKLPSAPTMFTWAGIRWMVHTGLPGAGTAAEELFVYHKSAIGHGMDTAGIKTNVGYNEEHDYSFCLMSVFSGAKLLQNGGVCTIRHDGSGFAATA